MTKRWSKYKTPNNEKPKSKFNKQHIFASILDDLLGELTPTTGLYLGGQSQVHKQVILILDAISMG